LKQHQRRKRHRLTVTQVATAGDEPAWHRSIQDEQRANRHDDPYHRPEHADGPFALTAYLHFHWVIFLLDNSTK
jgi:hypothetical protein